MKSAAVSEAAAASPTTSPPRPVSSYACAWCGGAFTPRTTGGHAQRFCRPACRRAFDEAGRRWVAEAIASGMLTLDSLRNGPPATRALLPKAISAARVSEPEKAAAIAPAEGLEEAAELLDDLLVTLLADLPDAWCDLADALPDELLNRLDYYVDILLSDGA